MKMSDMTRTVDIKMQVWEGTGYQPDWSYDFFEAGALPLVDDEIRYVPDVEYCIDAAREWESDGENHRVFVDELEPADLHDGWVWYNTDPGFPLKPGYVMQFKDHFALSDDVTCGNGGTREWRIIGPEGVEVAHGTTCICGRGCFNRECVRDDWDYHDTVVEEFREDELG